MARLPALPADAPIAARAALARLEEIDGAEGQRLYDGALNTALQPLRSLQPLPVECGHCYRGVAYYGLDASGAIVAACQRRAPLHRRALGGAAALVAATSPSDGKRKGRLDRARRDRNQQRPARRPVHPRLPVRLRLICPRCSAQFVLTNTRRLEQFLAAIACGSSRIVL